MQIKVFSWEWIRTWTRTRELGNSLLTAKALEKAVQEHARSQVAQARVQTIHGVALRSIWFTSSLFDRRDSFKRAKINISLLSGFCLWTLREKRTDLNLLFFGVSEFSWHRLGSCSVHQTMVSMMASHVTCPLYNCLIQIVSEMNLVDYPMTLRKVERY